MNEPKDYGVVVGVEKMPPCPICGKPILWPPKTGDGRLMVFFAHERAALAHDGCKIVTPLREDQP